MSQSGGGSAGGRAGAPGAPAPGPQTRGLYASAYSDAFVRGRPKDSLAIVQTRMKQARTLNDELADYFAERAALEDAYIRALQKMQRRPGLSDPRAMGPGFAPIWERLAAELGEVTGIHAELEKRIKTECEEGLRVAPNLGEWSRLKGYDADILTSLKEIDSLEAKLSKERRKADTASAKKASEAQSKAASTAQALDAAISHWHTEAPFLFDAYQKADSDRLEAIREAVTKFETAQNDFAQRRMAVSEQTMQAVLSWEPQTDMQEWVLRHATVAPGAGMPSVPSQRRMQEFGAGPTAASPTPPPDAAGSSGHPPPSRGGMGPPTSRPTPQRKYSTRRQNGDMGSTVGASSSSIHSEDMPRRPGSTLKSAITRFGRGRSGSRAQDMNTVYGALPDDDRMRSRDRVGGEETNGFGGVREEVYTTDAPLPAVPAPVRALSNASAPNPLVTAAAANGSDAATLPQQQQQQHHFAAPLVDAEGYSIPPPDRKPWEVGGAGGAAALAEEDEGAGTGSDSHSAMGNKVNMAIQQAPISESEEQRKAALQRVQSTLLSARPPSSGPTRRSTTSRRDRRDVRATMFNPIPDNVPITPALGMQENQKTALPTSSSPIPTSTSRQIPPSPSYNTSVISERAQSMLSTISGTNPFEVPQAIQPGLRASITESVNVLFKGSDVQKVLVVGEVSVSLRDIEDTTRPLHLRVDRFEQFEKAAPNPQFLSPLAGLPGEYRLDVAALHALGGPVGAGGQAVVLKYQLHVDERHRDEFVPIKLHAQWRCESVQTSFLLTYQANAESTLAEAVVADSSGGGGSETSGTAVVKDLAFLVPVAPSNVSNVLSKPNGIWSAEKKRMLWKIPDSVSFSSASDVANGSGAQSHKVLARFQVDTASQPQPVLVKWRIPDRLVSTVGIEVVPSSEAPVFAGAEGEGVNSKAAFDAVTKQAVAGKYVCNP